MPNAELIFPITLFISGFILGGLIVFLLNAQRLKALLEKNTAEQLLDQQNLASENDHLNEKLVELKQRFSESLESGAQWQSKYYNAEKQLSQLEQRLRHYSEVETKLEQKEADIQGLQQSLKLEHGKSAELQATLAALEKEMQEKVSLLKEAKDQLKIEFQNVANQLFDAKSEKFTTQNKTNLDQLLSPLREQLTDFKKRVEDVYDKESKERVSLLKEITSLKDINSRMSDDALRLTKALKGDTKIQGNWGEMVLERILETSGLRKGIEYETQVCLKSEAGKRRQPDVIIRLPENKDIVVDSKVSLVAWESYCSAEEEGERNRFLAALLQSVKEHIKQLSRKDYAHLEGIRSLDFVLMFLPVEGAFLKVLEMDSTFFSDAFDKNIMVVSPSTLLVTLRTIQNIWRYEYQNRNALEVARTAGGLHDQFVLFAEALEDIGLNLNKAQLAYDTAHKRLTSGRGNLVRRTQSLERMGAKTKKKMPAQLVEQAENDDSNAKVEQKLPLFE